MLKIPLKNGLITKLSLNKVLIIRIQINAQFVLKSSKIIKMLLDCLVSMTKIKFLFIFFISIHVQKSGSHRTQYVLFVGLTIIRTTELMNRIESFKIDWLVIDEDRI